MTTPAPIVSTATGDHANWDLAGSRSESPGVPHAAVRVFEVLNELVVQTRQQFKQRVLDAIHAGDRKFVVDLSRCGYVDSSGLGVLMSIAKKIRDADPLGTNVSGMLVLCGLNDDLRTLFELSHIDTLFTIADSRERAIIVAQFGTKPGELG